MIWKNLHIYIMYYVGMTCITGTLWTVAWYLAMKFLNEKGNIKLIYGLLKLAMIGYAMPLIFLAKAVYYIISPQTEGLLWCVSPLLYVIITVLFGVWFAGSVITTIKYIKNYKSFRRTCKACFNASGEEMEFMEGLKKKLHIRRKVRVYHGYFITSPYVYGFIRPCIYLPDKDFTEHCLEVVLTHELMHIKHNDVFWKPVFGFLCCVFWFNPLVWKVSDQYSAWVEAHCDDCCYGTYFSVVDYFETILAVIQENVKSISSFAPGLGEKRGGILWRVEIMNKFKLRELKAWMAVLVVACVVVFSVGASCAVEIGAEKLYSYLVNLTMGSVQEELQAQDDDMEEFYGDVSELGDDITIIAQNGEIVDIEGDNVVSPQSADGTLSGTISSGKLLKTGTFRKTAGESVSVAVIVTPSDKTVQAGLIYPTGTYVYVQGKNSIAHTFTVPSDGAYMVFVKNVSDTSVTVNCIYQ